MGKIAKVRFSWVKSPSQNVLRNEIKYSLDGGPEVSGIYDNSVEELVIDMKANSSIVFTFSTFKLVGDDEQAATATFSFSVGDLEQPLPVSGFQADIISITDEPEPPAPPTPEPPV